MQIFAVFIKKINKVSKWTSFPDKTTKFEEKKRSRVSKKEEQPMEYKVIKKKLMLGVREGNGLVEILLHLNWFFLYKYIYISLLTISNYKY